jgi:peptidoglycan biosynthesis protein MviN/MurJ (putative lipid II flippase)
MRWATDAMVVVTLPVAALMVALSAPIMRVLAFGQAAQGDGPALLGAALLGLAVGLPFYGGFLLLTRAAYAVGDSRRAGLAAVGSALAGATAMVLSVAVVDDGPQRLTAIGAGHTFAYALGSIWLAARLRPLVGSTLTMRLLLPLLAAVVVGVGAWTAMETWSPEGRVVTVAALAVIGATALAIYTGALRLLDAVPPRDPAVIG